MRTLLFILLLFSSCAKSQINRFFQAAAYHINIPIIRTVYDDQFNDGSVSSDWSIRNPGSQTVTESGGYMNLAGTGTTKDFRYMIRDTGYGHSMLRNYIIRTRVRLNSTIDGNSRGFFLGVYSPLISDYRFSSYGVFDFSTTNTAVSINASNDTIYFVTADSTRSGIPTVTAGNWYQVTYTMYENYESIKVKGETTNDSVTVTHSYTLGDANWPLRPNYFNYTMGIMGNSSVSVDYFTVYTYEPLQPKYLFVGNSITTGYMSGDADSAYAYKLRPYTNDSVHIMAGAGMSMTDLRICLDEIITVDPQYVFLNIGTNAGGSFATDYTYIVSTLEASGIDVIPCLIVNGGNPATGGTFNNSIATTYSDEIDLWTTGWNTMTIGNGQMVDAVHPSNAGMTTLRNIIKLARPDLFPL